MNSSQLETLRCYIREIVAKGHIRESTLPAGASVLIVPKKSGNDHIYIDYQKLNIITIKDRYTLPLIEEMQMTVAGAKWFTKIDLQVVYNHICIKEGDEWKTTF